MQKQPLEVICLRPATSLKRKLWHRCFPVNFAKFLRTQFYRTLLCDCFYILELLVRYILIYGEKAREMYKWLCQTSMMEHFCNNCFQCVKCVQKQSFFWSVFSRIRTEYGKILRIQSEYGKIWTRKTP